MVKFLHQQRLHRLQLFPSLFILARPPVPGSLELNPTLQPTSCFMSNVSQADRQAARNPASQTRLALVDPQIPHGV